jgi:hypothetical protein
MMIEHLPKRRTVYGKRIDPVHSTDSHSVIAAERVALLLAIFLASPISCLRYVRCDVTQQG